jgi:LAS superfamily LD-carboxypeptidase LdcB
VVIVRTAAIALVALAGACRHPSNLDPGGVLGTHGESPSSPGDASARSASESTSSSALPSGAGLTTASAAALASSSASRAAVESSSASPLAGLTPDASSSAPLTAPFGAATAIARYSCPLVQRGGPFRSFLAAADTKFAFVEGDDGLALVNRSPTGALPPTYSPSDLVDLHDGKVRTAGQCDAAHECLRRDAAAALQGLLGEMRAAKIPGYVASSFRGFGTQCWVFANWAHKARGGFCEATEQSALPGHSQHQLGTTVDLFTEEWAAQGARTGEGVFRNGFGCSAGGEWLDDNAWRRGFVVPYPIHPDDRKDGSRCEARRDRSVPIDPKTGYKNEPWHLRFIGIEAAARYHDAWIASGPGTPDEITLEQWLRASRGLVGDAELPVCDGCQCGACATLAEDDAATPCGKESLRLEADGRVAVPAEPPHLLDARMTTAPDGSTRVEATVSAPSHTPTQPPVMGADGPGYPAGATYLAFAPYPGAQPRRYADLPGAWRVAVEPAGAAGTARAAGAARAAARWPWRASLANAKLAETWNRANVVLPAKSGESNVSIAVALPAGVRQLRVALLRDGVEQDTRTLDLP